MRLKLANFVCTHQTGYWIKWTMPLETLEIYERSMLVVKYMYEATNVS